MPSQFCTECGFEGPADANQCTNCGGKLRGLSSADAGRKVTLDPAADVTPVAPVAPVNVRTTQPTHDDIANRQHLAAKEEMIWEGTTWPKLCCSPLMCSSMHWTITSRRVDYIHGCCGAHEDTMDIRRIKDIAWRRSCVQLMCCNRGTIMFHALSGTVEDSKVYLTTFNTRSLYFKVREAWTKSRIAVAVDV